MKLAYVIVEGIEITWKRKYRSTDNTKIEKKKRKLLPEKIKKSVDERYAKTHGRLTITVVFLDQRRVNVCEHMIRRHHMAPSLLCVHIHLLCSDQERHL